MNFSYVKTTQTSEKINKEELTRRSCLWRSSGFWAGRPTAGLRQCRIWRRRRSRATTHYPAWAGCPAARSPGYAYLREEKDEVKQPGSTQYTNLNTFCGVGGNLLSEYKHLAQAALQHTFSSREFWLDFTNAPVILSYDMGNITFHLPLLVCHCCAQHEIHSDMAIPTRCSSTVKFCLLN